MSEVLSIHPGLADNSRLPFHSHQEQSSTKAALAVLIGAGACAAMAHLLLDYSLRIPGHAILRTVFPMALGLSLAPRRGGGLVMGGSALCSAMLFRVGGFGVIGIGAMTSLVLTGPFLDAALWRA